MRSHPSGPGDRPTIDLAWGTLVRADFLRIGRSTNFSIARALLFHSGPHQYLFLMRSCAALSRRRSLLPFFIIARLALRRAQYRYGIDIPFSTQIGPGLYLGHGFGIVVNGAVRIGANCNLSQGVTLGQANRGKRTGVCTIGDEVYLGPNACVVGKVVVGRNVAIGANTVVVSDIDDDSVVVGSPGRVISREGASGYIDHIWTGAN